MINVCDVSLKITHNSNHGKDVRQTQIKQHFTKYLTYIPQNHPSYQKQRQVRNCYTPGEAKEMTAKYTGIPG